jgi:hypothetical protein
MKTTFTWIQIDHVHEETYVQVLSAVAISNLMFDIANDHFLVGAMDYAVLPGGISEDIVNKVIASFGATYPIEWI